MRTSELKPGLKVVTITSHPVVGYIVKTSCLGGKSELKQDNVFVKIRKLNGVITYATADMVEPFINGAD